jgi:hypothetical protein
MLPALSTLSNAAKKVMSKLARPSAAEFLAGRVTAPPRIASFAQIPFCRNSGKRPTVKGRSKLACLPENPE